MKHHIIFSLLSLLTVAGCGKEYPGDVDASWIGEWHSKDQFVQNGKVLEVYFNIYKEESQYGFMCETNCTACQCELVTSGPAKINKDQTILYIGKLGGSKRVKLHIQSLPHWNTDNLLECTVEDVVMIKN